MLDFVCAAEISPCMNRKQCESSALEVASAQQTANGLADVNDGDSAAATVNIWSHFRIPPRHAASEVHTRLDEFLRINLVHSLENEGRSLWR